MHQQQFKVTYEKMDHRHKLVEKKKWIILQKVVLCLAGHVTKIEKHYQLMIWLFSGFYIWVLQ